MLKKLVAVATLVAATLEATTRDEVVESILDRGFPVPEQYATQLGVFDTDGDKNISRAEFDAIPEAIRLLIRASIRERVRAATSPKP